MDNEVSEATSDEALRLTDLIESEVLAYCNR